MCKRKILICQLLLLIVTVSRVCAAAEASAAADCDLEYGRSVFIQCAACHTYLPGDFDKSGPNLHGIFGRRAASIAFPIGFSAALKKSAVVWNERTLNSFLRNPAQFIPGNKMTFFGLDNPQDRADLICFLNEVAR